jgi:hypothetical protein
MKHYWQSFPTYISGFETPEGMRVATVYQTFDGVTWSAFALETPARTAKDALENHSHRMLGQRFRSARAARAACEKFIREYQAAFEPCSCREFSPPKKPRK